MAPQAIDWFRLIWDMIQRGHAIRHVARRSGIPETTIKDYMQGSQPPHWRGEILVAMWSKICKQPREQAPTTDVVLALRVTKRETEMMR